MLDIKTIEPLRCFIIGFDDVGFESQQERIDGLAGIRNCKVYAAELLHRLRDKAFDRWLIRNVARHQQMARLRARRFDGLDGFGERGFIASRKYDVGAVLGEIDGDRAADAAARARYERNLTFKHPDSSTSARRRNR
jgi:hypothetical protein